MALINEKDAKAVSGRLEKLAGTVRLVVFTQEFECAYCRETRADALGVDRIPAIAVLGGDGSDYGIRLYGIPADYEFASLLGALDLVARGGSGLAPASRQKLKAVSRPLALQVFVTPTCPYCPRRSRSPSRWRWNRLPSTPPWWRRPSFPTSPGGTRCRESPTR